MSDDKPVVRDYVLYGEQRIKDRRTGETTGDVRGFFAGHIDRFISGLVRYRASKRAGSRDGAVGVSDGT